MLDIEKHQSYSSHLLSSDEHVRQLQTRLGLYQVFLRVYEQNKDLLNEVLGLECSGYEAVAPLILCYLQGVVVDEIVYIVTNLIGGKTQAIPHTDARWTIGRDDQKASLVLEDPRLSRCHAYIAYDFEQQCFHLTDLDSTNGTFVNGEQIFNCHVLKDGDRVRMGSLGFTFFAYQILPQTDLSSQDTPLSSNMASNSSASENKAVGRDRLITSEKITYPSDQPSSTPNKPDDTMVVPTLLRRLKSL